VTSDQPIYRGFDRAALDRQYSPSSRVADLQVYLEDYARRSAYARAHCAVWTDLRYGLHPEELLDFFPVAGPPGPVEVFVHGGYWQELSKAESAFVAADFVAARCAFAAVNYALAPSVRLDEIVSMVRRAVCWIAASAGELGVDPRRIHLSGTSAGAHLVAMALLPDRVGAGPDASRLVAGATLLSGVYDLEPLRHTYVNDALGLDRAAAWRNSPLHHLPAHLPPVVIARGGHETEEFARQHDLMAAALRARTSVVDLVRGERNHFDLPYELGDPGTALGAAVLAQMHLRGVPA
jgi:arylformamidase